MKIGFIGLGIMGKPMAKNLLKAGHALTVTSHKASDVADLAALGASGVATSREAAAASDVIFTMLPNSPNVKDAVLGPDGVIEGVKPGSILVDTSSIAPLVSREIAASLAEKGVEMLDAPVSGGEPKAVDGTLAFMVGGKQEVFDKVYDLLLLMGSSAVLCGEIGAGNTTKLANQIVVAANISAVGEALVLGKKAGVSPELIYKAVRGGLAGSTVMDAKAPMMMDGNFKPGFRIELHIKDLNNVVETAHEVGAPLPLTSQVMEMMQWLKQNGCAAEDHSALVKYYEGLANTDIRREK